MRCFVCVHCGKCGRYSGNSFLAPRPQGYCLDCKTQNAPNATVCKNCGRKLPQPPGR